MKRLLVILLVMYQAFAGCGQRSTKQKDLQGSVMICVSSTAYAYHKYKCFGLSRCTHQVIEISKQDAIIKGYKPCKICYKKH